MDIGELLEQMKRETKPKDIICGRSFGEDFSRVYALGNDIVVKIYQNTDPKAPGKYGHSIEGNARWAYFVGRSLYSAGLNVPRYYGIASVSFSDASMPEFLTNDHPDEDTYYLFMQRIHGVIPGSPRTNLTPKEFKLASDQFQEQANKAEEAGFHQEDCSLYNGNALFDRSQQKLFFIDFVRWQKTRRRRIRDRILGKY